MCTAVVAQSILDALAVKMASNSVFTAFDITKVVRNNNPNDRISHRDVRSIVHQEFMTGQFLPNYNSDSIELDLPNNPVAIVYYPDGKQPTDHPLAAKVNSTSVQTVPTNQSVPQSSSQSRLGGHVKDGDSYICKATADGRINLPKDVCDQVSKTGGTVDISVNGSVLYKKPQSDGRVRVTTTELGGGDEYRVSVDTAAGTIVITKK